MSDGAEWLDGDGYPTEAAIQRIKAWDVKDPAGLADFCKSIWHWGSNYWEQRATADGVRIEAHTGGWSGNEEIIGALESTPFWSLCWQDSRRGGHYSFIIPTAFLRGAA